MSINTQTSINTQVVDGALTRDAKSLSTSRKRQFNADLQGEADPQDLRRMLSALNKHDLGTVPQLKAWPSATPKRLDGWGVQKRPYQCCCLLSSGGTGVLCVLVMSRLIMYDMLLSSVILDTEIPGGATCVFSHKQTLFVGLADGRTRTVYVDSGPGQHLATPRVLARPGNATSHAISPGGVQHIAVRDHCIAAVAYTQGLPCIFDWRQSRPPSAEEMRADSLQASYLSWSECGKLAAISGGSVRIWDERNFKSPCAYITGSNVTAFGNVPPRLPYGDVTAIVWSKNNPSMLNYAVARKDEAGCDIMSALPCGATAPSRKRGHTQFCCESLGYVARGKMLMGASGSSVAAGGAIRTWKDALGRSDLVSMPCDSAAFCRPQSVVYDAFDASDGSVVICSPGGTQPNICIAQPWPKSRGIGHTQGLFEGHALTVR